MCRNVRNLFVLTALAWVGGCVSPGDPTPEKAPAAPAAVPPEPARSALTIAADARYTIVAAAANKCLQPAGQSSADGARVQIAPCNGSIAQQFRLQAVPGGYHALINASSAKCVDVPGATRDNGANLQQFPCNGGPNQQWVIADAPGGYVRFVARHSGKVADVQGAATADGTSLIQWPWSGDLNQRFKLTAVAATEAPMPDAGDKGASASGAGGRGKPVRAGKKVKEAK